MRTFKKIENLRFFNIFEVLGPGSVRRRETRPVKICVYTSECPSVWWSQITSGDSNDLSIEDIHSGIDILGETAEIRMVWWAQGPQFFFVSQVLHFIAYIVTRSRIPVSSGGSSLGFTSCSQDVSMSVTFFS